MMIELFIAAVMGACVGSFVSMLSYRLPRGLPWVAGTSRCTSCNKSLGVRDLFPVLSWCWNKGRCSGCKTKVSARYPLTEITQAALFVWVYSLYQFSPLGIILLLASVAIMVMVVVDFEHYILPDSMQVALATLGLAAAYVLGRDFSDVLGMAASGLGLGLALSYGYKFLMKKDGLGFGDVKLLAVAGCWLLPMQAPVFLFYGGIFGVATAIVWRALKKGPVFPFGPALLASLFLLVVVPESGDVFWNLFGSIYAR